MQPSTFNTVCNIHEIEMEMGRICRLACLRQFNVREPSATFQWLHQSVIFSALLAQIIVTWLRWESIFSRSGAIKVIERVIVKGITGNWPYHCTKLTFFGSQSVKQASRLHCIVTDSSPHTCWCYPGWKVQSRCHNWNHIVSLAYSIEQWLRRLNTQSTSTMSQFYMSSFSSVSFSYTYI